MISLESFCLLQNKFLWHKDQAFLLISASFNSTCDSCPIFQYETGFIHRSFPNSQLGLMLQHVFIFGSTLQVIKGKSLHMSSHYADWYFSCPGMSTKFKLVI